MCFQWTILLKFGNLLCCRCRPRPFTCRGQVPLTTASLAAADPQQQKQMLDERLFPLIQNMYPDLASKITSMLLEIDNAELLHMLESRESLRAKVG